ncbi:MAG: calcium-binding protein [Burkholderiaceae bacterium]|nr:MAG: calcium-binding protein [Burkholderiaceae bacterium]
MAGAAGAGVTVNMANLDDMTQVNVAVDLGQTLAVSNIASGGTVTYEAAQTAATTVTVSNAATGTDDSFNIKVTSAAARNIPTVTASNVETINFLTDDTATTTTGIEHTASLTAAAATKITVAGDAGLTLTFTGTALTTFDASGVTDGDVTWTAGALAAAATVKGGAASDANVIVLSAALDDITYTGGSGTDTITMNHATNHDSTTNTFTLGNGTNTLTAGNNDGDNTVTGGSGVDTITVGNGSNTITTLAGNDVITVGTGHNVIDSGTGNDTITIGASAATNTVNVGTGTDNLVFTGVQTAAGYYTSVTGMGAGDTIDFSATANDGGGLAAAVLGAKMPSLGGSASFANYLDAAAAGNGSTDSAIKWFQYNGNTYIVVDNSAAATFQDGGDQVVELVGLVDLSTSTQDGSYVITLV